MAFESYRDTQAKKKHFSNLVKMAQADGEMDPHEAILIQNMAMKLGISPSEFATIVSDPDRALFNPSNDLETNWKNFYQLMMMAVMDNDFSDDEKEEAKKIGASMRLDSATLDKAINHIADRTKPTSYDDFKKAVLCPPFCD